MTPSILWLGLLVSPLASMTMMVHGLDVQIKKIRCESRPVTVAFDYICNGDYLCTFGEPESMEGHFNYYGLVDQYDATADDSLMVSANFIYSLLGFKHTVNLMNNVAMPICHSLLQPSADNVDGDCPADGTFNFETTYDMPDEGSVFVGWAASGWSGVVMVDMYLNRTDTLVGKCKLDVTTMVSGALENGIFRSIPSARNIMFLAFGAFFLALVVCLGCGCCARQRRRKNSRKVPLLDTSSTTGTTSGAVSVVRAPAFVPPPTLPPMGMTTASTTATTITTTSPLMDTTPLMDATPLMDTTPLVDTTLLVDVGTPMDTTTTTTPMDTTPPMEEPETKGADGEPTSDYHCVLKPGYDRKDMV